MQVTVQLTKAELAEMEASDLVHIAKILGHKSVTTTKRLVEGDPARLADIVAGAV